MSTATCAGCTSPLLAVEVCRHLTNSIPGEISFDLRTAPKLSRHGCADADCPRLKVCSACWHDLVPVHAVPTPPIAQPTSQGVLLEGA